MAGFRFGRIPEHKMVANCTYCILHPIGIQVGYHLVATLNSDQDVARHNRVDGFCVPLIFAIAMISVVLPVTGHSSGLALEAVPANDFAQQVTVDFDFERWPKSLHQKVARHLRNLVASCRRIAHLHNIGSSDNSRASLFL